MAIKESSKNTKWYYTLTRVILFYACSIVVLISTSILTKNMSAKMADILSILLATIFTFILVLIFVRWEKLSLKSVGITSGRRSASRFFIGYAVGILMAVTQALIVLRFGHFQLNRVPKITTTEILSPLLLYFLVASREELVFRSYSLRSLNYSLTPALALLIMTAIFIFEHVVSGITWKMALLGSGAGGILFGLAALKTKGLALPLGLHSAWNFGQWSLGFKNEPGIWEAVVEKGFETRVQNIGLTAFLFVMGLAIAGVCIFYKRERLS